MPVQQVRSSNRKGWRYGTSGKVYFGPNGRSKAERQAAAIHASGYVENADGDNCGIGSHGFEKGNTCAKGGGISIKVNTDDWRGDTLKRKVEQEHKQIAKAFPKVQTLLNEHPVAIEIGNQEVAEGGGEYDYNNRILLSTKFNETRKFKVGGGENYIVDESPSGTFRHELGHHVAYHTKVVDSKFLDAVYSSMREEGMDPNKSAQRKQWISKNISQYASTNLEEAFCESFSAFTHPKYGEKGRLPSKIEALLGDVVGKHLTTNATKKRTPNPLRTDPTRTASLRRRFATEMRKRFKLLKKDIQRVVVEHDMFGLEELNHNPTMNAPKGRFRFHTTSQKLQAFNNWLKRQIQFRIMGNTVQQIENGWWRQYAEKGYRQGAGRAFDDLHKRATGKQGVGHFYDGSKDEFLRSSFGRPVQIERIKVLAGRTYSDLKGVTEQMSTVMSRVLTDGLTRGDNPRRIARDLDDEVDDIGIRRAELIARTEIIRSHAEGQLDALEEMGVESVGVMVEWSTAGDGRVCQECADLEGVVLSIDEAHNKIPRHPSCRCSWLPANVGEEDDTEQIRGKSAIDKAFEKSIGDDEDTSWQGADYKISKERLESILNANPNHDENGRFSSGSSSSPEDWSDRMTFKDAVARGEVKDGIHIVEPFVYHVKEGKAEIQKHLDASFDYDKGLYNIKERKMPSQRIEDRTFIHGSETDLPSVTDLQPGEHFGRFGENEFKAIYFAQKGTGHGADDGHWGSKTYEMKLSPDAKIAKSSAEIKAAMEKHPDKFKQDALVAEGYHGVARIDERGDVWELALFDNKKITANSWHSVKQYTSITRPDSVLNAFCPIQEVTSSND